MEEGCKARLRSKRSSRLVLAGWLETDNVQPPVVTWQLLGLEVGTVAPVSVMSLVCEMPCVVDMWHA